MLSQPFPGIFIRAKQDFYKQVGIHDVYHVLDNYFYENRYDINTLNETLQNYQIKKEELKKIFEKMSGYSGQLMKFSNINEIIDRLNSIRFVEIIKTFLFELRHKQDAKCFGSKEIFCEEFFPFFLDNNFKCILITRDPRDIIVSLNYGKGKKYGGKVRPTLFNLRNWRKSIAFMIYCMNRTNFFCLRYEDIVKKPFDILDDLTTFLGVQKFERNTFAQGIFDQNGSLWASNSSHHTSSFITKNSVESFKKHLPNNVLAFIETVCFPEMKYLGYTPSVRNEPEEQDIVTFKEPYSIIRTDLEANYSSTKVNKTQELNRLNLLSTKNISLEEIKNNYIFPEVYSSLKNAVSSVI